MFIVTTGNMCTVHGDNVIKVASNYNDKGCFISFVNFLGPSVYPLDKAESLKRGFGIGNSKGFDGPHILGHCNKHH